VGGMVLVPFVSSWGMAETVCDGGCVSGVQVSCLLKHTQFNSYPLVYPTY
jgi:hypothetical protein